MNISDLSWMKSGMIFPQPYFHSPALQKGTDMQNACRPRSESLLIAIMACILCIKDQIAEILGSVGTSKHLSLCY